MNVLLDTNTLLWLLQSPSNRSKIGPVAKILIASADTIYVSAASIFEIRIKEMIGKIKVPAKLLEAIEQSGLKLMPITAQHANALIQFKDLARHDPFDRILMSQALCESAVLLTADESLLNTKYKLTKDARF